MSENIGSIFDRLGKVKREKAEEVKRQEEERRKAEEAAKAEKEEKSAVELYGVYDEPMPLLSEIPLDDEPKEKRKFSLPRFRNKQNESEPFDTLVSVPAKSETEINEVAEALNEQPVAQAEVQAEKLSPVSADEDSFEQTLQPTGDFRNTLFPIAEVVFDKKSKADAVTPENFDTPVGEILPRDDAEDFKKMLDDYFEILPVFDQERKQKSITHNAMFDYESDDAQNAVRPEPQVVTQPEEPTEELVWVYVDCASSNDHFAPFGYAYGFEAETYGDKKISGACGNWASVERCFHFALSEVSEWAKEFNVSKGMLYIPATLAAEIFEEAEKPIIRVGSVDYAVRVNQAEDTREEKLLHALVHYLAGNKKED